jgi:hypothetical protein
MLFTHQHVEGSYIFLMTCAAPFVCQICHSTKSLEASPHPFFMVWCVSMIDDRQFIPSDPFFSLFPTPKITLQSSLFFGISIESNYNLSYIVFLI